MSLIPLIPLILLIFLILLIITRSYLIGDKLLTTHTSTTLSTSQIHLLKQTYKIWNLYNFLNDVCHIQS